MISSEYSKSLPHVWWLSHWFLAAYLPAGRGGRHHSSKKDSVTVSLHRNAEISTVPTIYNLQLTSSGRNKGRSRSKESKEGKDLAHHGDLLGVSTTTKKSKACSDDDGEGLLHGNCRAHVLRSLPGNLNLKLLQQVTARFRIPFYKSQWSRIENRSSYGRHLHFDSW